MSNLPKEPLTPNKEASSRASTPNDSSIRSSAPQEASSRPTLTLNEVKGKGSGETPAFRLFPPLHRRFPTLRFLQAILVFTLAIVMLGAGDTSEKRYERVGHNMMCACGCGQILLECNHVGCPDSARMIGELHEQMATGGSDKTILDWFVQKYGATVLAAPLRGGFDNVAWITPIALFLLAILGTAAIIRIWKARTQQRVPLKIRGMTPSSTEELRERIRRETEY